MQDRITAMRVARNANTSEQMFKTLLSMIRECKKRIEHENEIFEKVGVSGFVEGQTKALKMLQDFYTYYKDVISIRDLKNTVPEKLLTTTAHEYDELHKIMKKYHINLEISSKVSDIFLDSMKKNIQSDAKKDYGYNKDGMLVSDKKILSSMPSISFNNKV